MSTTPKSSKVGHGIAFAALCASAVALEITGHEAGGLWVVIVIWAFCF